MILNRRSHIIWGCISIGFILQIIYLTFVGCSHTTPYYHPELSLENESDVSQNSVLLYRIVLIGDAGQPKPNEPVLDSLKKWCEKDPDKTTVVFLGDNMYPDGMTEDRQVEVEEKLVPQLDVITLADAHGIFIPGNHDWTNGKKEGYQAILAQQIYIDDKLSKEPKFLPKNGSPGPVSVDLPTDSPVFRLIVLDTQWWLQENLHSSESQNSVIIKLKELLKTDLPIIVVGHHPIESYGQHGGFFDWKDHLFPGRMYKKWIWIPMPILGSVLPLTRRYIVDYPQDINGKGYKELVKQLNHAFASAKQTPLLLYASGHDHSLQVLEGNTTDYLLISGLGSSEKASPVSHGDNTLFAHQHSGFMSIDFLADGRFLLRVIEPIGEKVVFHYWLK
ncbi:metallophosphoesterase [Candidatus Poribacteria bacterium]|nr:metallophosphoesterase [Candidatus Poribacteria bacterium]